MTDYGWIEKSQSNNAVGGPVLYWTQAGNSECLGTLDECVAYLKDWACVGEAPTGGPADSWSAWDPKGYDPTIMDDLLARGFYDSTWHNDVCPSFINEAAGLRLWIYEADMNVRELREPRFILCKFDDVDVDDGETLCQNEQYVRICDWLRENGYMRNVTGNGRAMTAADLGI